jgi:phenylpropionate dioxygenase-like ring-hydroxylating dioxygenase large terminal subunit
MTEKSRFPFTSFPTGWFVVAFSRDLKPGDVKPIRNFGKELVIWRTDSGKVQVADPYCPHLGAHLGHGGVVVGEDIRCPFHFWKFETGGKCVDVPFAPVPPRARINVWPTIERNDVIMVWHDLAGRPPQWEMPQFEKTEDYSLADFALFDGIRAHTQEILENGADWLHFYSVHGTARLFGHGEPVRTEPHVLAYSYRNKEHEADPTPAQGNLRGEVWLYGPGCGRNLNWGEMAKHIMVENTVYPTPVDENTIQIRAAYRVVPKAGNTAPIDMLRGIFAIVGPEIERQLTQDFQIWANKAYLTNPMLAASDGPILGYRKWYSQFYPAGAAREAGLGMVA